MKHQTPDSMKFKRLMRRLKESKRGTVGILEMLWITTQKNAPQGDIGRFSDEELAIEFEWEGDPETLVTALVDCGWLDRCENHRLVVHDWKEIQREYREPIGKRRDLQTAAWKRMRLIVIAEDGTECHYCGCDCSSDPTVDHVTPFVHGGEMNRENLVVACRSCNGRKGDRTL